MNMDQKGFINIIVIIGIVILAGVAGYFIARQQAQLIPAPPPSPTPIPSPTPTPTPVACSHIAKQCPDGSYVTRRGPNCEFTDCPKSLPSPLPKPDGVQVSLQAGQREGSLLVEKIYPDHITGNNFQEYPIPTDRGYPITLRVGEVVSNGCTVTLTLIRIEGDIATFVKKTDFNRPCPICLAKNTLIDTPSGSIAIQNLQKGDTIWTLNKLGARVPAKILETVRTPVPSTHQVIHLVLDDGRELFVSPGHPTGDGRTIGNLSLGDSLDGGRVITAKLILYQKDFTYDILPSQGTGLYWANGILMGSTIIPSNSYRVFLPRALTPK